MRTFTGRPVTLLTIAAMALVVAACDGGSPSPSASPSSTASSVPRDASKAPLVFTGDPDLRGDLSAPEITCSFPAVDGLRISVFAQASNPTYSYRMAVTGDSVFVHVDSGTDTTFRERNFQGTGVSRFDAARGAHLDAQLTEAAPTPGVDRGSIGTITAVKGSIDCGGQTPGSSTITVTGDTPVGRYEAARLDPVVVECYPSSGQLTAIGIAHAGATKVLLMVSLGPDGLLNLEEAPEAASQRYYGSEPGAATVTSDGGHAEGTVVLRDAASPSTLRIEGDARCGTPTRD